MSFEMAVAKILKVQPICAINGCRGTWNAIEIVLEIYDGTIKTTLAGQEVNELILTILGSEPSLNLTDSLYQCRGKTVGVCLEQTSTQPFQINILSFFTLNEEQAAMERDGLTSIALKPSSRSGKEVKT